ncbi:MAG: acetyl-CoA C-acyltransferase [Legionellales bacterium]|nr:acetyl-CoA C-acyltransferase [Legionellales bacterium]|tara:strand:- start:787 stop:1965 length:1179 start_codon:yes stop_codon:yes gene_type:complete
MEAIYILSAKRTPMAGLQGALSSYTAADLGAHAIEAALQSAKLKKVVPQEVIMGCVLTAGQGQAPARQAILKANLPQHVGATTINKMCGSGMKAVMLAHDLIQAGTNELMVAGGMESMSNAPYLLKKARSGYRLGHGELFDHMFLDGLEDAYEQGNLMGIFAERCAAKYAFTRESQDAFAMRSLQRAQEADEKGYFKKEISPIDYQVKNETYTLDYDETPRKVNADKIPKLRPAFSQDGTVTAANASSISDGAAALVLAGESYVKKHKLKPIAKITGHSSFAHAPDWFTTAPIHAIEKLLKKVGWHIGQVDLFEINEAFAVVTLAAMAALSIPHEKTNIFGGACALGHPIGASGARIIVTLINALQQTKGKKGLASLCIGGGEATAIAIELC